MGRFERRLPLPSLILPALHMVACVVVQFGPSEGSWQWFPFFFIDFPISIFLMFLGNILPGFVVFGIFGTLWWYLINASIWYFYRKFEEKPE